MSLSLPVVSVSRRYRFSASHRLHVEPLGEQRNRDLFGKCNNPFGHGHNYTLQLSFAGPVDPQTGMVVNLGELDPYVRREVLERFHLANLNCDPAFKAAVPSTEHLAMVVWHLMLPFAAQHRPARLLRVRLEETNNNAFDFYGEAEVPGTLAPTETGKGTRPQAA